MKKIIVIEGTDCSGKETQSKMLLERLNNNNIDSVYMTFPAYDTPTGKIIGGSYLGKESIGQRQIGSAVTVNAIRKHIQGMARPLQKRFISR